MVLRRTFMTATVPLLDALIAARNRLAVINRVVLPGTCRRWYLKSIEGSMRPAR